MKKTILAAVLGLFCLGASAQLRPSFIIQGGYQGANMSIKGSNSTEKGKLLSGFRVGVAADFDVYASEGLGLSIQPGINFSTKGSSMKETAKLGKAEGSISGKRALYYIDVPVLANLKFGASDLLGVYVNAGPYFGYGVGGKQTSEVKGNVGDNEIINNKNTNNDNPFGDKGLKAFDWGVQVGAGVEYNRFLIGVGTQFGIQNISNKDKEIKTNTSFFATVGYRF